MLFLLGTWRSIEHLEGIAQENMTGHPALILFLDKMRQCVSRESTAQYIRCGLSIKEAILRSGPYVFLSTPLQIRPFREAVCAVVDGGVGSQDALDCCFLSRPIRNFAELRPLGRDGQFEEVFAAWVRKKWPEPKVNVEARRPA